MTRFWQDGTRWYHPLILALQKPIDITMMAEIVYYNNHCVFISVLSPETKSCFYYYHEGFKYLVGVGHILHCHVSTVAKKGTKKLELTLERTYCMFGGWGEGC